MSAMKPVDQPRLTRDSVTCPYCGADLRYGGDGVYTRLIGVYDPTIDATIAWKCPDCGKEDAR